MVRPHGNTCVDFDPTTLDDYMTFAEGHRKVNYFQFSGVQIQNNSRINLMSDNTKYMEDIYMFLFKCAVYLASKVNYLFLKYCLENSNLVVMLNILTGIQTFIKLALFGIKHILSNFSLWDRIFLFLQVTSEHISVLHTYFKFHWGTQKISEVSKLFSTFLMGSQKNYYNVFHSVGT